MKNIITTLILLFSISVYSQEDEYGLQETVYQTALGAMIENGNGVSLYGPQIKQFLGDFGAVNGQILFGKHLFNIGADFTLNYQLLWFRDLSWYFGGGAQLSFMKNEDAASFALRPLAGIEYKPKKYPIVVNAEIKPWWSFGEYKDFELMRFGFGVKYVLNRDIW